MFKRSHACVSVVLGAIVILAGPVMAQSRPDIVIEPPEGSVEFGRSLASGGDADGDGHDDIFIADPGFEVDGVRVGRWFLYSGATQEVLWSVVGDQPLAGTSAFRSSIPGAFIGDIDDDGGDDLIVGRPGAAESRGIITVHSGRTGQLLFEFQGADPEALLGVDASGVGDVIADGTPDFAFIGGTPWTEATFVSIRSGRDGGEIHRLDRPYARRVRGLGDLNRDGHADVVIGHPVRGGSIPSLSIIDGRTGAVTRLNSSFAPGDLRFGYSLATRADLTGDGIPDVLTSGGRSRTDKAYVLSGRDGRHVSTIEVGPSEDLIAGWVATVDVTGDGLAEPILSHEGYGWHIANGRTHEVIHNALQPGSRWGVSFGNEWAAGDIDGDGLVDVMTGRWGGFPVVIQLGVPMLIENPTFPLHPLPLVRGFPFDFRVYGARPGRAVHLLANRAGEGCTFVPRLGICIDLLQPLVRVAGGVTQADGMATITVDVPIETALGPAWLQAIDPTDPNRGAITSNVMQVEIIE